MAHMYIYIHVYLKMQFSSLKYLAGTPIRDRYLDPLRLPSAMLTPLNPNP